MSYLVLLSLLFYYLNISFSSWEFIFSAIDNLKLRCSCSKEIPFPLNSWEKLLHFCGTPWAFNITTLCNDLANS